MGRRGYPTATKGRNVWISGRNPSKRADSPSPRPNMPLKSARFGRFSAENPHILALTHVRIAGPPNSHCDLLVMSPARTKNAHGQNPLYGKIATHRISTYRKSMGRAAWDSMGAELTLPFLRTGNFRHMNRRDFRCATAGILVAAKRPYLRNAPAVGLAGHLRFPAWSIVVHREMAEI